MSSKTPLSSRWAPSGDTADPSTSTPQPELKQSIGLIASRWAASDASPNKDKQQGDLSLCDILQDRVTKLESENDNLQKRCTALENRVQKLEKSS